MQIKIIVASQSIMQYGPIVNKSHQKKEILIQT
jgi:hypothetical protein